MLCPLICFGGILTNDNQVAKVALIKKNLISYVQNMEVTGSVSADGQMICIIWIHVQRCVKPNLAPQTGWQTVYIICSVSCQWCCLSVNSVRHFEACRGLYNQKCQHWKKKCEILICLLLKDDKLTGALLFPLYVWIYFCSLLNLEYLFKLLYVNPKYLLVFQINLK